LLIGLGIPDALGAGTALRLGPHYWATVLLAAVVFTLGSVLLVDRHDKWLTKAVHTSAPAATGTPVAGYQWLAPRALWMAVVFGAFTAVVALISAQGIVPIAEVGLVPGMMGAGGLRVLVRAERVRAWERERDSELLIPTSWRWWRTPAYFVRSH
jgi:hypothetical protein